VLYNLLKAVNPAIQSHPVTAELCIFKKETDLTPGTLQRVRAMNKVVSGKESQVPPDCAGSGLLWVGGTD